MSNPSTDFLDILLVQLICLIIAFALKCSKRRQHPHLRSPFQWLRLAEVKCSRPPLSVAAYVCIYIKADLPLIIFYVPGCKLICAEGLNMQVCGIRPDSGASLKWSYKELEFLAPFQHWNSTLVRDHKFTRYQMPGKDHHHPCWWHSATKPICSKLNHLSIISI